MAKPSITVLLILSCVYFFTSSQRFFFFGGEEVLEIKPKALHMLVKCSTTKLHSNPLSSFSLQIVAILRAEIMEYSLSSLWEVLNAYWLNKNNIYILLQDFIVTVWHIKQEDSKFNSINKNSIISHLCKFLFSRLSVAILKTKSFFWPHRNPHTVNGVFAMYWYHLKPTITPKTTYK
jgi:hypothetical protein